MRISDWSSDVCSSDLLDPGSAAEIEIDRAIRLEKPDVDCIATPTTQRHRSRRAKKPEFGKWPRCIAIAATNDRRRDIECEQGPHRAGGRIAVENHCHITHFASPLCPHRTLRYFPSPHPSAR